MRCGSTRGVGRASTCSSTRRGALLGIQVRQPSSECYMRLNWYRLRRAVVAVALLVACSEDPTASLAGAPAGVSLAFDYLEVNVDDSVIVDAVVRDGSGTPLDIPVTVTSTNTPIVTVSTAQDPPHVLTRVRVRGADVGTARVIATAAGLADTMDVTTFAARVEVTDLGPTVGTLVSGQ